MCSPSADPGYVMAPKEPTEAMITRGNEAILPHVYPDSDEAVLEADAAYQCYRAMLAAVDTPQTGKAGEV